MIFLIAAKVQLMAVPTMVIEKKDTLVTSLQKGTFSQDAQALYTTYKKVATEKANLAKAKLTSVYKAAGPKVDSYVKQAKQAITRTSRRPSSRACTRRPARRWIL